MSGKAVMLLSGGLDSVTLAYLLKSHKYDIHALSFDYGQRHRKELEISARIMEMLHGDHNVVNIRDVGFLFQESGSSLVTDEEVPEGHYAEDNMKSTIVPNRNAIMLTIAFGVAASERADIVAFAAHGGDHFVYPDCRPAFVQAFRTMQTAALDALRPELQAPFLRWSKADIVRKGHELRAPLELTWSCYKGGDRHCGKCGTCVERAEAFQLAGVPDPTTYEDAEYWKEAVASR